MKYLKGLNSIISNFKNERKYFIGTRQPCSYETKIKFEQFFYTQLKFKIIS